MAPPLAHQSVHSLRSTGPQHHKNKSCIYIYIYIYMYFRAIPPFSIVLLHIFTGRTAILNSAPLFEGAAVHHGPALVPVKDIYIYIQLRNKRELVFMEWHSLPGAALEGFMDFLLGGTSTTWPYFTVQGARPVGAPCFCFSGFPVSVFLITFRTQL